MSNFRFGADDYKLSYYPPEASDGIGGVDWDKVESVEIEFDVYVKVVRCMDCVYFDNDTNHGAHCWKFGNALWDDYDGFCAWGERRTNDN